MPARARVQTCPCALAVPLDYRGRDPQQAAWVMRMILMHGEWMTVVVGGHRYRVSRHCIALHGIVAEQLAIYDFERLDPEPEQVR